MRGSSAGTKIAVAAAAVPAGSGRPRGAPRVLQAPRRAHLAPVPRTPCVKAAGRAQAAGLL